MVSLISHCWFLTVEEPNVPDRWTYAVCALSRGNFWGGMHFFCLLFHNPLHENPTC